MPYDSTKVRELLRAAPQHSRMPNGEMVDSLAEQLREAEAQITLETAKATKAHGETADLQIRYDNLVQAERKLRESSSSHTQFVAALRSIAKSPKGAQKTASQALLAAGLTAEEQPAAK